MTNDSKTYTCAEFQAQLAELIGSGENISNHPHIKTCELCRALLADLETIAEAARQLFPVVEVEPPDTLWSQIESAIKSETDDDPKSKKSDASKDEKDDESSALIDAQPL